MSPVFMAPGTAGVPVKYAVHTAAKTPIYCRLKSSGM